MKDIAHHAQRAIVRQRLTARQRYQLGLLRLSWGRSVEPLLSPDKHIVSQAAQEHQHLLGFKTLFVAFGQADACKCWNEAVGVSAIILARKFSLLRLPRPISRALAEEEYPLISRVIAKKSTASFQYLQSWSTRRCCLRKEKGSLSLSRAMGQM
jgi:hypothetical protein